MYSGDLCATGRYVQAQETETNTWSNVQGMHKAAASRILTKPLQVQLQADVLWDHSNTHLLLLARAASTCQVPGGASARLQVPQAKRNPQDAGKKGRAT